MVKVGGRMGRVSQPVLSLLPAEARSVGPAAGLVEGPEGGVVFVFGLATFTWSAGDEIGRRLAAVQLLKTKVATAIEVASAFAVTTVTLWRWTQSFTEAGVSGLVRARSGPKGPSKLTEPLIARIVEFDAQGLSLRAIAARTEVSTATVRVALGRVAAGPRSADPIDVNDVNDVDDPTDVNDVEDQHAGAGTAELVVLAAPVSRTAERAAARAGDLIEAPVVITEGAHLPQAGLLLALPALEMTGLLAVAEQTFPPMSKGFLWAARHVADGGVHGVVARAPRGGRDPAAPG